jgi:hypothetical protein
VLLPNECLLLFLLFISLSTQSGNFWIHPLKIFPLTDAQNGVFSLYIFEIFNIFKEAVMEAGSKVELTAF